MAPAEPPVLRVRDRIYLAGPFSPYRDDDGNWITTEENITRAKRWYRELRDLGLTVFCPHMAILDPAENGLTDPELIWRAAMQECFRWLEVTAATFLMPDWDLSRGAVREAQETRLDGRPLFEDLDQVREALARGASAEEAVAA